MMIDWLTLEDEANESWLITELARSYRRVFDRRAKDIGLTRAQWQILGWLRRYPGIHQMELADSLDIQPITLTRHLDRLERGGWVVRKLDRSDRRLRRLYLTDESSTVVKRMRDLGLQLRQEALAGFTPEEHDALVKSLKKIKSNLCPEAKGTEPIHV
ncbi:MAG: winged helix-turn-helix transcriptional regulator [Alphaproteobacteria bacterium]|nr:winged helix-turn-helix transcriptional regulator [Alphaproteobacteria bacterium]